GELAKHIGKILGLAEIAIDRGEAHIGDVVERAQMLHHGLTDYLRGNLGFTGGFEFAHDGGDHLLHPLRLDPALAQRDLHRAHQLVAVERHAAAVALDHGQLAQLNALEGREAEIAGDAHAPPADHGRVLGRTRVLYLRIETVAVWTAHPRGLTLLVDRKPIGERLDPFFHRAFAQRRLAV